MAVMDTVILLRKASKTDQAGWGVRYESVTRHEVRGAGVFSQGYPRRLTVWDNTVRPRDDGSPIQRFRAKPYERHLPGKYLDPHGVPTDDEVSYPLSPEPVVLSAEWREQNPYGPPLRVGDKVRLMYPDGSMSGYMTVCSDGGKGPYLRPCKED